jgi:thioredoxin-like negative regulator of GroEL
MEYISIFFILCIYLPILSPLEYKKNKGINFKEKNENMKRILEMEHHDFINKKISQRRVNFMIVFYIENSELCKELIDTIENVSTYTFTKGFEFLKVNCSKHKNDICDKFGVVNFPTLKVYLKGEETVHTPNGSDLESLLEYIDKINSPSLVQLKSNKELFNFSKNYGDVSFLFIDNDDNSQIYKCFEIISENPLYKPVFYFAFMNSNKFRNDYNIKLPAVLVK